jgi:PPOX class probable F420-dependent enzyme
LVGRPMVSVDLSDPRASGFLTEPRVLRLATVDRHCVPHVSSAWFIFESGCFFISTSRDRLKVKNIRVNPRVALIVDTDTPPYYGVIVEGEATIEEDRVLEVTSRIVDKYVAKPDRMATLNDLMRYPRVIIRVKPLKVMDIMSYRHLEPEK